MVKCLPTMWKTPVRSLGLEDPLEKEMAIHSSTIAWKIPWTEEPGRLQSTGSQRIGYDWATSLTYRIAQLVKNLPAIQESLVQFLDWEDPLEKEMEIHSSTIAWKIPWTEEPGRLQSMGSRRVGHNWLHSSWCFLFFNLLTWSITLIDLHILKNSCIPRINPIWSWCRILLNYRQIWFAGVKLRNFASMFISDIGL